MPVPLLKVDGPVPPVAESVSEGNQGGGGPNAFVSLFTGIPPFTIERLDIPMVIDKKVSDEFMKIAFAIFPFLNRHQSRPYDKTKCDEIVTIVSELLNQGEYVEKSESINLNAIWKGLKDACEYDPSKVDVRLQYFSYSGFVANNEQDLIDAIFHISHNSSGLCDSWVSFMCAVFLIALQSKSMYVLRGENNLPAWRDMVMHNVILHALNLIYLKQTVHIGIFKRIQATCHPSFENSSIPYFVVIQVLLKSSVSRLSVRKVSSTPFENRRRISPCFLTYIHIR